jgi:hypothetical protein
MLMNPPRQLTIALAAVIVAFALGGCVSTGRSAAIDITSSPRPPELPSPTSLQAVSVPDSLDTKGRRPIASALQSFIDSTPDQSVITFPEGAVYLLDRAIRLDGRRGLTFEGNGTVLLTPGCDNDDSAFLIGQRAASSDIVIRDFEIVGDNEDAGTREAFKVACEHQHAIATYGASRIDVSGLNISKMHGDCLYVGIGPDRSWSTDIRFRDSTCVENGRQAVAVVAGERVHVEGIRMDLLAMHVFDIEPNDGAGGARDILFAGSSVGSFGHSPAFEGFFFAANGSLDAMVERVRVEDNVVTKGTLKTLVGDEFTGFDGQRSRRDIAFVGNRSEVPGRGPLLTFKHTDNVAVLRNEQPLTSGSLSRFVNSTGIVTD